MEIKGNGFSPLGSVVIVNYNGGQIVLEALGSVFSQTIIHCLEVLVVDNASIDGSYETIQDLYGSRISLFRLPKNIGFAAGNNFGFKKARGKYLLLLNNDAVAEPRWAEELFCVLESDPRIGMCTPKILCYQNRRIIDNLGHKIFFDGLNRSIGHLERDGEKYNKQEEVLFASGCAGAYRRHPVMAVGGFCEDFFAYGDDADLGLKLRLLGFRCLFIPSSIVLHRQSCTSQPFSAQKLFWIERNRIWVMLRFLPLRWILLSPVFCFLRLFGSWLAGNKGMGLAGKVKQNHSSISLCVIFFKAWISALGGSLKMLEERRELFKLGKIPQREWLKILEKFRASTKEMTFGK